MGAWFWCPNDGAGRLLASLRRVGRKAGDVDILIRACSIIDGSFADLRPVTVVDTESH